MSQETKHLPFFDVNSTENADVKSIRNSKKGRKHNSSSFSCSGVNGYTAGILNVPKTMLSSNKLPFGKNSKHSRNGYQNNHKKAGAGGKGMWGKPELDNDFELDENDPDYDSDVNDPVRLQVIVPVMEPQEFDDAVINWTKEYFERSDHTDFIDNLNECNMSSRQRCRIAYLCITTAMQYKSKQRELTSQLFVYLSIQQLVSMNDMQDGFRMVLEDLPDIIVDVPDSSDIVGRFIARAVADDLLPPKFVQACKLIHCQTNGNNEHVSNNGYDTNSPALSCEARQALAKAENLLSARHAYSRLATIWGVIGAQRPTGILEHELKVVVEEFFCSSDISEAMRCLRELEVPHFHHELVYQAVLFALERSTEDACGRVISLLSGLSQALILSTEQLESGVRRIYKNIPDICLDVPAAYALLNKFVDRALQIKDESGICFFPVNLANEVPVCNRRRFVSEGGEALKSGRLD